MLSVEDSIHQCVNVKHQLHKLRHKLRRQNKQRLYQLRELEPLNVANLIYGSPVFSRDDILELLNNGTKLDGHEFWSIVRNPNVDLELADLIINTRVFPFSDAHDNVYNHLSANPNLTEQYIIDHPSTGWAWNSFPHYKNISIAFLRQRHLSIEYNPNLTLADLNDLILNNEHIDWYAVSINPAITFETVVANPNLPWNWSQILTKSSTPADCKDRYPHLPWPNGVVRPDYNKPFPSLRQFVDQEVSYRELSQHRHLTLDFVFQHHNEDWSWYHICNREFNYCAEIAAMEEQLAQARQRLAKHFYWQLVDMMHQAPLGHYFLNDLEMVLPADKKLQLRQLRAGKCYDDVRQFIVNLGSDTRVSTVHSDNKDDTVNTASVIAIIE